MKDCALIRLGGCVLWVGCLLAASARWAGAGERVEMPQRGVTLRISFGLKDKKNTSWDGTIELSQGRVLSLTPRPPQAGKAQAASWQLRTRVPLGPPKRRRPPVRPVVLANLDAPPAATVSVTTPQGAFKFVLGDLALGQPASFLDGQVRVARIPLSTRLTTAPTCTPWRRPTPRRAPSTSPGWAGVRGASTS